MSESDPKLLEGLRALAADGPREAPACVEGRLLAELRRRSRARRRNRWLTAGAAAIAAGLAVLIWIRPATNKLAPAVVQSAVRDPGKTVAPALEPLKAVTPGQSTDAEVASNEVAINEVAIDFDRLPGADELPPLESAMIVRVQLPMSSLRLIGFAVNEEGAGDSVLADLLLGQDGLARGVRLVE